MDKNYSDKEVFEFLGGVQKEHIEVIKGLGAINKVGVEGLHICSCGYESPDKKMSTLIDHIKDSNNPTINLEWMLEKLHERKNVRSVNFDKSCKPRVEEPKVFINTSIVGSAGYHKSYMYHAPTPALALRGAVCKLIESEEKK